MDSKHVLKQFVEQNFTKTEAQRRLRILHDFENWRLFEQKGVAATEPVIKQFVSKQLSSQDGKNYLADGQFLHKLGVDVLNYFVANKLSAQLSELENGLVKSRTVMVYVAVELPESEIEKLGVWFKLNVGSDCLIDIQYKASLIGGAAIAYQGQISDYSLKRRIESEKKAILKSMLDFRR